MFLALISPLLIFTLGSGQPQQYIGLQNCFRTVYSLDSYESKNGGGLGVDVVWNNSSQAYTVKTRSQDTNSGDIQLFNFVVGYNADEDYLKVQFANVENCNYKFGILVDLYETSGGTAYVDETHACFYDAMINKPVEGAEYVLIHEPLSYTRIQFRFSFTYYSQEIYESMTTKGYSAGFKDGYNQGRQDFENQDATMNSIFEGILSIGLIPIEFFLSIFNFEIFGINLTSVVSAILSLCVILILMRYVLGGKSS